MVEARQQTAARRIGDSGGRDGRAPFRPTTTGRVARQAVESETPRRTSHESRPAPVRAGRRRDDARLHTLAAFAGWSTKTTARRTSRCGNSKSLPAATRRSTAIRTNTKCSCSKAKARFSKATTPQPLRPGTVVFVAPDDVHQFRNTGTTPLKFLCFVPNSHRNLPATMAAECARPEASGAAS